MHGFCPVLCQEAFLGLKPKRFFAFLHLLNNKTWGFSSFLLFPGAVVALAKKIPLLDSNSVPRGETSKGGMRGVMPPLERNHLGF